MPNWLAPWPSNYRPLPGEFAAQFQTLSVALETAGPTLVGTNTTNVYVPVPNKTFFVAGASITAAANYTNTTAVTVQLKRNNAGSAVALTGVFDLTAAGATPLVQNFVNVPITGTDQQCTCNPGDVLYWEFIAALTFLPATASPRASVGIAVIA
jgi:hypothetical protein